METKHAARRRRLTKLKEAVENLIEVEDRDVRALAEEGHIDTVIFTDAVEAINALLEEN